MMYFTLNEHDQAHEAELKALGYDHWTERKFAAQCALEYHQKEQAAWRYEYRKALYFQIQNLKDIIVDYSTNPKFENVREEFIETDTRFMQRLADELNARVPLDVIFDMELMLQGEQKLLDRGVTYWCKQKKKAMDGYTHWSQNTTKYTAAHQAEVKEYWAKEYEKADYILNRLTKMNLETEAELLARGIGYWETRKKSCHECVYVLDTTCCQTHD